MSPFRDSIFALSSGTLPAGIAVVRLSGRQTRAVLSDLAGPVPTPRRAELREFRASMDLIDRGLLLFFSAPHSFTGEDCAEFHLHGGRATVAAFLGHLASYPLLRQAEPGEFTRRALVNGKMDLLATEALADLIDAETEVQRAFALNNGSGVQAGVYKAWREELLGARAAVEAELDFSDEADVGQGNLAHVWRQVQALREAISLHLDGYRSGRILRNGYTVAICGRPNVGKSSLLNYLAGSDIAIVTDIAGTTRDLIRVPLDLGGRKVNVVDTAGIRHAADPVERAGVERAIGAAGEADLVLWLDDGREAPNADAALPELATEKIAVRSKADLEQPGSTSTYDVRISTVTGQGLDTLLAVLDERVAAATAVDHDVPFRARHVGQLNAALRHLDAALVPGPAELAAEELRLAGDSLGRIIGVIDVEDVLGSIFSRFCIGK